MSICSVRPRNFPGGFFCPTGNPAKPASRRNLNFTAEERQRRPDPETFPTISSAALPPKYVERRAENRRNYSLAARMTRRRHSTSAIPNLTIENRQINRNRIAQGHRAAAFRSNGILHPLQQLHLSAA